MANFEFPASEESDSEVGPAQKKAKFTGAFKYKTKLLNEWKKTWPFVAAVPDNPKFQMQRMRKEFQLWQSRCSGCKRPHRYSKPPKIGKKSGYSTQTFLPFGRST